MGPSEECRDAMEEDERGQRRPEFTAALTGMAFLRPVRWLLR
jgi:hypothetical protein